FPRAVHLSGYGNTLFDVLMEPADGPRQALEYFPAGDRVLFHVVGCQESDENRPDAWPPPRLECGSTGRVLFHRLDPSCLLVGVLERDEAERIAPSPAARVLGWYADGLRDPRPPARSAPHLQLGLY